MLWAAAASVVLVGLTVLIHYEVLRRTYDWLPRMTIPPRQRIVVVLFAVFFAHTVEVWLYGIAYYLLDDRSGLDLGHFGGEFDGSFAEYVYFSTVSYTSLGLGDVWPLGPMRLITGVEALNGLVLIGWSATFTFIAMRRFWEAHPPRKPPLRSTPETRRTEDDA